MKESEPQPGDVVAGKYRIEGILGRGGMGRVLAARHTTTGKKVALKWVLDPDSGDAQERFAREARAAGRIHHANVVDVYDVLEHEGAMCLVMELLHGESLASLLGREKRLTAEVAIPIAIQIARGLEAAHAEGVIHRDLKPANLFLTEGHGESGVKILDFGISKILEGETSEPVTKSGAMLGTPHYMAPEQVMGMGGSDPRLDVYSLSAVIYEMLAGHPPHQHEKMTALLVQIATVPTTPIDALVPELPALLAGVIMKGLAKNPQDRFPSARALALALEPFAGSMRFETGSGERKARATVSGEGPRLEGAPSSAATLLATPRVPAVDTPPTRAAVPLSGEVPTLERPPRSTREAAPRWLLVAGGMGVVGALGLFLSFLGSSEPETAPLATPPPRAMEAAAPDEAPPPPALAEAPPPAAPLAPTEPSAEEVPVLRRRTDARGRLEPELPAEPALEPIGATSTEPESGVAEVTPPATETPPPELEPRTPPIEPRAGRIGLDDF